MKKINMSFKETEIEIYNFIKSKLSPSIYLKQLVIDDMDKLSVKEVSNVESKVNRMQFNDNNIDF